MSATGDLSIDSLIKKLKKSELDSCGDTSLVNQLCDEFISKLKKSCVGVKGYNINIHFEKDTFNKVGHKIDVDVSTCSAAEEAMGYDESGHVISDSEDDENVCCICYESLNELSIKLKCGHMFHYECIIEWYKELNTAGAYDGNKIPRTCSYCKNDGGFLKLHPGQPFLSGIHDPTDEIVKTKGTKSVSKSGDGVSTSTGKISDNGWQCMGLTKKKSQCKNYRIDGKNYCHVHLP